MSDAVFTSAGAAPSSPPRFALPARGDPRYGQIIAQLLLISLGILMLGFQLSFAATAAAGAGALAAEWIGRRVEGRPFDPLSPLITTGSLTLLFRADAIWLFLLAGAVAVGSKFILKTGGRHIFNPAALALFALPLMFDGAWLSPGQWGSDGLRAALFIGVGALVLGRAARLDTMLAFLSVWAALTFGRALWYGDPMAIPVHQMQSGALIVFAFFMITDPATTPATRLERIFHAAVVAALGFWLAFSWQITAAPVWALIFAAPLVGLLRLRTRSRQMREMS